MLDVIDLVAAAFGLGGLEIVGYLAGDVRRRVRKRIAESWPIAQGVVLSAHLGQSGSYHEVRAPYSFSAAGERYGGQYRRVFRSEARARETYRRLLQSSPPVRYKPRHPDTSILDDGRS